MTLNSQRYNTNPEYWQQLVGYAILADLASGEIKELPQLSEIGIYFSRHATVWHTSTEDIYTHEKYDQSKAWF